MDAELKAKWVTALRSGEYRQTMGVLRGSGGGYCCLGVLCAIQGADFDAIFREYGSLSLSENPKEFLGQLPHHATDRLSYMNDHGESFNTIANYIEDKL